MLVGIIASVILKISLIDFENAVKTEKELEALFGQPESELEKMEKLIAYEKQQKERFLIMESLF